MSCPGSRGTGDGPHSRQSFSVSSVYFGGAFCAVPETEDSSTYERNPEIMFGKPVIKGSRITGEHILRQLADGMTVQDILQDHPHITREDILAAQEFAADSLAEVAMVFENPTSE